MVMNSNFKPTDIPGCTEWYDPTNFLTDLSGHHWAFNQARPVTLWRRVRTVLGFPEKDTKAVRISHGRAWVVYGPDASENPAGAVYDDWQTGASVSYNRVITREEAKQVHGYLWPHIGGQP
jgi:hypothetical protein